MPKLNDADEVYKGSVQVDRIYKGDVLIWPNVETWSPWMLVGSAPAAAPAAWFAAGLQSYPSGHQQVWWRYSLNTQRVVIKGIAYTPSTTYAWGALIMTLNIDPAVVPRTTMAMMAWGVASPDLVSSWQGSLVRFDLGNNATYHSQIAILHRQDVAFPAGGWFNMDTTWSFGNDR